MTVNWIFDNFTANETFWTDSNGLEMQERRLNYRPTWNYSGDQNISANYFPVNSGIAMRSISPQNSTRQVTVINERSTGGSADLSFAGGIELIHNRRLLKDDNRGVGEPLNETDSLGNGMRVNSRYWLQIVDFQATESQQRQQQLLVDLPLQYFFAFNYTASAIQETYPAHNMILHDFQTGKILTWPMARNEILVRAENVADLFDPKASLLQFDLVEYCYSFWLEANHEVDPFTIPKNATLRQMWEQGYTALPLL